MRPRKKYQRVCSAAADGQVSNLSGRELDDQVEWGLRAVSLASSARRKAEMGLRLGQLCRDAGRPVLAIRVWSATLEAVSAANWAWEDEPINPRIYSFDGLVAGGEARELGRRIDSLWRELGHPELAVAEAWARSDYRDLWLAKYQEPYWGR